jgi:hypothetical protein
LFSKGEQAISKKASAIVKELGQVQWVESYVADDKLYCVYIAPNEEMVREHGRQGAFPSTESPR